MVNQLFGSVAYRRGKVISRLRGVSLGCFCVQLGTSQVVSVVSEPYPLKTPCHDSNPRLERRMRRRGLLRRPPPRVICWKTKGGQELSDGGEPRRSKCANSVEITGQLLRPRAELAPDPDMFNPAHPSGLYASGAGKPKPTYLRRHALHRAIVAMETDV